MKRQKLNETSAVMVLRSPLSQIVSWKHHWYDMGSCVLRPYDHMNQSCEPTLSACKAGHPELHRPVKFKSTVDVYNQYARQYRQIVADGRFRNAHIFTYEDVVYNTEEVVRALAKLLGKPVPD